MGEWSYINNNLNFAKLDAKDPTKNNLIQPMSIKGIIEDLEISKDDFYRVLPTSKDKDLKLHLKKQLDSSFVNNYLDTGLKTWQENMDKQPVLNEYNEETNMCPFFTKTKD